MRLLTGDNAEARQDDQIVRAGCHGSLPVQYWGNLMLIDVPFLIFNIGKA